MAPRIPYVLPIVCNARGYSGEWATASSKRIVLPIWARTTPIVLHEVAHYLLANHDEACGGHGNDSVFARHGPFFVRLYIELLRAYHPPARTASYEYFARLRKIKVAPSLVSLFDETDPSYLEMFLRPR